MPDIEYFEEIESIMGDVFPFLTELNFRLTVEPFFFEKGKIQFQGKFGQFGITQTLTPCFQNKGKGFVKGELRKYIFSNRKTFLESIYFAVIDCDPQIPVPTKIYDFFAENRLE